MVVGGDARDPNSPSARRLPQATSSTKRKYQSVKTPQKITTLWMAVIHWRARASRTRQSSTSHNRKAATGVSTAISAK